jgi:dGTPase
MGYYRAEEALFREITEQTGAVGCRYPLTYLLEAADDIAYLTADIEDAVKKGVLSYPTLLHELQAAEQDTLTALAVRILEEKLTAAKENGLSDPEMNAVQNWAIRIQYELLNKAAASFIGHYAEIMDGTFQGELLTGSDACRFIRTLKDLSVRYIYDSKNILALEISAGNIIASLLDQFVPAAVRYDTEEKLTPVQDRLMRIISENYLRTYHHYAEQTDDERERLYLRLLLVTDYICGMTDTFARSLYRRFCGIE